MVELALSLKRGGGWGRKQKSRGARKEEAGEEAINIPARSFFLALTGIIPAS